MLTNPIGETGRPSAEIILHVCLASRCRELSVVFGDVSGDVMIANGLIRTRIRMSKVRLTNRLAAYSRFLGIVAPYPGASQKVPDCWARRATPANELRASSTFENEWGSTPQPSM